MFPRCHSRDAVGFEHAVEFPDAFHGIRIGEDGEGGVDDVEGVVGELEIHPVHHGCVDAAGARCVVPCRRAVDDFLVFPDEIFGEVRRGDVQGGVRGG